MKALRKEVVASVSLVETKISQDELAVLESALEYALDSLDDEEIERHTANATKIRNLSQACSI